MDFFRSFAELTLSIHLYVIILWLAFFSEPNLATLHTYAAAMWIIVITILGIVTLRSFKIYEQLLFWIWLGIICYLFIDYYYLSGRLSSYGLVTYAFISAVVRYAWQVKSGVERAMKKFEFFFELMLALGLVGIWFINQELNIITSEEKSIIIMLSYFAVASISLEITKFLVAVGVVSKERAQLVIIFPASVMVVSAVIISVLWLIAMPVAK